MQAPTGGAGSVAGHLRTAEQYHRAGRIVEAERLYREVLRLKPSHPVAMHYLGLVLKSRGELTEAESLMRRSIMLAPQEASFPNNLANVLLARGDNEGAASFYRTAVRLKRDYPEAHYNLGVALKRLGQTDDARRAFEAAISHRPAYADALVQLGVLRKDAGEFESALKLFDRAIAANPQSMDAHYYRGATLSELGREGEALDSYAHASDLDNSAFEPLQSMARLLLRLGRILDAVPVCERLATLKPDDVPVLTALADVYILAQKFEEALAVVDKARKLSPDLQELLLLEARALLDKNEAEVAVNLLANLSAQNPDNPELLAYLGHGLNAAGRTDEGKDALRRALKIKPGLGSAYLELADATRFTPGHEMIGEMERALELLPADAPPAVGLLFALGKAYDDIGDADRAFDLISRGNTVRKAKGLYDEDVNLSFMTRVAKALTRQRIEANNSGSDSELPIFIVGMPRSGTTLTEQILASHPDVVGGGERMDLSHVTNALMRERPAITDFAALVSSLSRDDFNRIGRDYVKCIEPIANGAKRVTDKLPGNFTMCGVIALALPKARIIHCRRDPVDTCLSCFMKNFSAPLTFTDDLGRLGRYYRAYEAIMTYWREALPPGLMLEVQYEDVVADLEGQARRLVEFCGLPWDDRCLAFHETKRVVRTASVSQVREKIYSRAAGRWRRYEKHLGPLIEALGDLGPRKDTHDAHA